MTKILVVDDEPALRDTVSYALRQEGFSQTTQYVATNDNFLSSATNLSNPFPGGILKPAGSSLGSSTFLGQLAVVVAFALYALGFFFIRRFAKIDV